MNIKYALALGLACTTLGAAALAGCGDDDAGSPGQRADSGTDSPTTPPNEAGLPDATDASTTPHVPVLAKGPSNGSSVALSPDESRVVVCNRDKGSVTVFTVGYAGATPTMTKVGEVAATLPALQHKERVASMGPSFASLLQSVGYSADATAVQSPT